MQKVIKVMVHYIILSYVLYYLQLYTGDYGTVYFTQWKRPWEGLIKRETVYSGERILDF